jgi:hypothetical protein
MRSLPPITTIGIVRVKAWTGNASIMPAATMTSGLAAIRSAAAVLRRSGSSPVMRRSTTRLRPSIQPSRRMASSKPRLGYLSPVTMYPMWARFGASCAAARHPMAAAAAPSNASRRFTR